MVLLMKFIIFTLFLFLTSCAGTKNNSEETIKDMFNMGIENLENEKYLQAQSDFKNVLIRGTGTDLGDDAQYYLGESYYRNKEYLLAISEYEKLTRKMGYSPFVEDARFKICEAYSIESPRYYHDQEYTLKALERYQEFLDDYPNSKLLDDVLSSIGILREKLAKKAFETGILYMKMDEYESAKLAFQIVIDEYYDTSFLVLAQKEMVISLAKNREIDNAVTFLELHKNHLTKNDLYDEAYNMIGYMQSKIASELE